MLGAGTWCLRSYQRCQGGLCAWFECCFVKLSSGKGLVLTHTFNSQKFNHENMPKKTNITNVQSPREHIMRSALQFPSAVPPAMPCPSAHRTAACAEPHSAMEPDGSLRRGAAELWKWQPTILKGEPASLRKSGLRYTSILKWCVCFQGHKNQKKCVQTAWNRVFHWFSAHEATRSSGYK